MLAAGDVAFLLDVGARQLATAFVRQGHYALEPGIDAIDPPPDLGIERIGDLLDPDLSELFLALRQCAPRP